MRPAPCNYVLVRWQDDSNIEFLYRRSGMQGQPPNLYFSDGQPPNYPLMMTRKEALWSYYRAKEQQPEYQYEVREFLR